MATQTRGEWKLSATSEAERILMKRKFARIATISMLGTGLIVGPATVAQAATWHNAGMFSSSQSCMAAGYAGVSDHSWQDYRCTQWAYAAWELDVYF